MSVAMDALNKRGFVPLYYQIQQTLLNRITSGELKEGDMLESEEELSRRYLVSRMTARQALQGLKAKGYAVSERGRGTFVMKPKLSKSILMLESFTEEIRKKGITPSSRLLQQKVSSPDPELAERLKLSPGDRILYLRRLRLANEVPLAIEESNIPLKRFQGLESIDFSTCSLYETMHDRYGIEFGWADETIEAMLAAADEAKLLTIPNRASLLCISRTLMASDGSPLEFALSRYRGDRYRASLRVTLSQAD
ncbi:GntR family transcriptional regulator [Granulicella sp. dw_53]|uniref:GntR family transcriptional regulator n=1 Tax=Granulicella sp. dw_53 TaxID=2719792 RepID=UPI001BD5DBCB|nr:GntR family transcriptional regulator [Granulicella sp. dw_53]